MYATPKAQILEFFYFISGYHQIQISLRLVLDLICLLDIELIIMSGDTSYQIFLPLVRPWFVIGGCALMSADESPPIGLQNTD